MSAPLTPDERVLRGKRAAALLADPLFGEVFDVLVNAQIAVITSPSCEDAVVLEARRMILALNAVKSTLVSFNTDAKMLERHDRRSAP